MQTDVTSLDSVQALADGGAAAVRRACTSSATTPASRPFGEIHQASHRDWVFTMNVNFWGVVHGVETFVPLLIEQGQGGHIVNTASMAGLVGMRWLGIYCASKFAVVGLTEALHARADAASASASACCAR